ncbi:TPA: hypothetical protein N0F65_009674 [Lagenidium giganteum]|uniref:DUF4460 domain-containing protein n=1 Tax=Lagenidium giganteum TaxID=4803 RepID=A0AAV2YWR8_9STRA|nr:TPA: hypothetical protein N0F65_009674 [Lagenidium giganteum]
MAAARARMFLRSSWKVAPVRTGVAAVQRNAVLSMASRSSAVAATQAAWPLLFSTPVRTKMSERALRRKQLRKQKENAGCVPQLKDTLRKLYLRTHPDLFGQYPEQQAQNDSSYKELMGILDSIENNNEFPSAKTLVLPFYLKTPIEGKFKQVSLHLRTSGGACHTLVEAALGKFFEQCGLPSVFKWNDGSWGKVVGKDAVQNTNMAYEDEDESEKIRAAAAKRKAEEEARNSAPAYNPVDTKPAEDSSIERILNELNDVFEIIAAVPLLDEEEYGELRRYYEVQNGLDEIEARGYRIKDATHKLWKGERNITKLTTGLDADSAQIVQRIFMHTLSIEQKVRDLIAEEQAKEQGKTADKEQ